MVSEQALSWDCWDGCSVRSCGVVMVGAADPPAVASTLAAGEEEIADDGGDGVRGVRDDDVELHGEDGGDAVDDCIGDASNGDVDGNAPVKSGGDRGRDG